MVYAVDTRHEQQGQSKRWHDATYSRVVQGKGPVRWRTSGGNKTYALRLGGWVVYCWVTAGYVYNTQQA